MRLALLVTPATPLGSEPVAALVLAEPAAWDAAGVAALRRTQPRAEIYARLDGPGEGLDAALALPVDGVVAPVADGQAVGRLAARIAVREAEVGRPDGATRILAVIGTPRAVLAVTRIAGAGPRLGGLVFDGAGLGRMPREAPVGPPLSPPPAAGETGGAAPSGSVALTLARGLVLLAAAASGLPAWVLLPAEASERDVDAARRDGFAGLITPDPARLRAGPA